MSEPGTQGEPHSTPAAGSGFSTSGNYRRYLRNAARFSLPWIVGGYVLWKVSESYSQESVTKTIHDKAMAEKPADLKAIQEQNRMIMQQLFKDVNKGDSSKESK